LPVGKREENAEETCQQNELLVTKLKAQNSNFELFSLDFSGKSTAS